MQKSVFLTSFFEQKRTIESLLNESKANSSFYFFLSASALITTLGFLLDSVIVIVGGMLVAPLLFPILSLGMGVTTSSRTAINRALIVIGKSVVLVFALSFVVAFILGANQITPLMQIASKADLLFFLVAFISGAVVSYAWVKENISSSLPGIAITVSLLPPLALTGVAVSLFSRVLFTGALTLFLVNMLGIVLGSTIVFSLFGFSGLQDVEEKKIKAEKEEQELKKAAAAAEAKGPPSDGEGTPEEA